jgi:lysophospholipase L1-like esterase
MPNRPLTHCWRLWVLAAPLAVASLALPGAAGDAAAGRGAGGQAVAQRAAVRILPLGDSITYENHQGDVRPTDVRIAYRYRLWELLTRAGRTFDFVGNRHAGMAFFTDPDDADNAGFPGIKTDELAMLVDTGDGGPNWRDQAPGPYLDSHPADIVLLHIGTNGVGDGNWTHVERILDSIDRWEEKPGNNHVTTVVARIIDRWPHSADTATFNNHVEAMVRRRYAAGDDVMLVDIENGAGIDYRLEMDDRLHPRRSGYSKMAEQWFAAVEAIMDRRPYVAIRTPLPGASFDAGLRVTIEADVFYHWGTVNRVEFHLDGVAIGADTTAPYTLDWTAQAGPPRELKAVAVYGGSSRSESRAVVLNPWRILALGDGITQGSFGHDSYRYPLWKRLLGTGLPFRFVGSMALLDGEVLGYWREERKNHVRHEYAACENQWFDRDRYHEGHIGWRADQIMDGHALRPDSGRLSDWLQDYTADVALVHAGTADAMQGESAASTAEDLRRIIITLRGDNPRIAVLLAKLIPAADEMHDASIAAVNARVDALAAALSTASSPVIVVDQGRGFDAARDTYDGIHPNAAGEQKLAERWFGPLAGLLRQHPPPGPSRSR